MPNVIDTNNSTTSLLPSNGIFTGISTPSIGRSDAFTGIIVTINSNANSSSTGVSVQFSDDNIKWDTYFCDIYIAPLKFIKKYFITKKFYRIMYSNGTTAQTSFSLSTYLTTLNDPSVVTTFHPSMLDSNGRLKISNEQRIIDMRVFKYGIISNPQIIVGKIINTYTSTIANCMINLSGTGIGSAVSQSRKYCIYSGTNGIEIVGACVMNNGGLNTLSCVTRMGYFDSDDGWFFEYNSKSGISINVRNSITSTVTSIPQNVWNVDRMDGTGPSGISLDFTSRQVFIIQISNTLNFGFQFNSTTYYCHNIIPSSQNTTAPPVGSFNLPIRYEIQGTSTSDSGSMLQGASTATSWSNIENIGKSFSANVGISSSGVTITSTESPILAISGNANYRHQNIVPKILNILNSSGIDTILIRIRLYLGGNTPTTGTTVWTDVNTTQSVMKYSYDTNILGTGTFTPGTSIILFSYYNYGKQPSDSIDLKHIFNNLIQLTSNVDNVPDILLITGQVSNTPTSKILASLDWHEIY